MEKKPLGIIVRDDDDHGPRFNKSFYGNNPPWKIVQLLSGREGKKKLTTRKAVESNYASQAKRAPGCT